MAALLSGSQDQKISIKKPITTSRPIRKMIPAVLARNFNMAYLVFFLGCTV